MWEDNTTPPPTLQPSDQNAAAGPGYSHWAKVGGNAAEPNGQACAYAGNVKYQYFSDGSYVQSGTGDNWGWVDVQCTYVDPTLHYICEFEVACTPAAGKRDLRCPVRSLLPRAV